MDWDAAARRGDWPAAWAISDRVLAARDPARRDDPTLPYHLRHVWDGRPPAGRDVLVRCYHGLGDTLHFARFLAPLAQVAAAVTLEAPPPLVTLLRRSFPAINVRPFDPAYPLPPAACDIEIMELAHALRIAPERCPPPYLAAPPGPPARRPGALGLCWVGGDWDPARSIAPPALASLLRLRAGKLWSLQPDRGGPAFVNNGGCGFDVDATAALILSLPHVVTIDSMVAHLAGALGHPATVLLRAHADWRWGAEGENCALYPRHRLLRQARGGDWAEPIRRAAALLDAEERGELERDGGERARRDEHHAAEQEGEEPDAVEHGGSSVVPAPD